MGLSDSLVYNPFASPKTSTTYSLLTELNGCFDTASINVGVYPITPIKAYGDTTILYGELGSTKFNEFHRVLKAETDKGNIKYVSR